MEFTVRVKLESLLAESVEIAGYIKSFKHFMVVFVVVLMKACSTYVKHLSLIALLQALLLCTSHAENNDTTGDWHSLLLQDNVLVGKIYDLRQGKAITEKELVDRLRQSRFVLIGEKHDNMDHHHLEARIMRSLFSGLPSNEKAAVVYEMLDDAQQSLIDKLSSADSLDDIKSKLQWPDRGWQWESYGPLFKLTLALGARLVPGNIDNKLLKSIYQSGTEVLDTNRFRSLAALSNKQKSAIQQDIFESHCEMMPYDSLMPMVNMQIAKDASMANAMVQSSLDRVILITGGFHASRNLGVPQHLELLAPEAKVSVLMLAEVSEDDTVVTDYTPADVDIADFIWFTPKATDKDYCESLRKHKSMQQN